MESGVVRMLPTVDLAYPFEGRWLTQNSPANRVPSHGTTLLATSFAIDFVPVNEAGRTPPITFRSLLRPEPAERFPGFGRPILAPVPGVVVHYTTVRRSRAEAAIASSRASGEAYDHFAKGASLTYTGERGRHLVERVHLVDLDP